MVELIYFAHGVVENAGDDSAVGVAGRSGVAVAQAEVADEGLAGLVEDELEAHAIGIILAADEAVVLLQVHVDGFVALRLGWHEGILTGSLDSFMSLSWGIPPSGSAQSRLLAKEARNRRTPSPHFSQKRREIGHPAPGIFRLRICFAFGKRILGSRSQNCGDRASNSSVNPV